MSESLRTWTFISGRLSGTSLKAKFWQSVQPFTTFYLMHLMASVKSTSSCFKFELFLHVGSVSNLLVGPHQSLASMTSTQVKVNRALSVPPDCFDLPLVDDSTHTVTIASPVAHIGPVPVQMRLISSELREGQVTETLRSKT